jgi:putative transposase
MTYKSLWLGGKVVAVPAHYTSQTCSACGFVSKANRVNQEQFLCLACNHKENADINAAKNILAAGQVVLACGETALADSLKQELRGKSNLLPA